MVLFLDVLNLVFLGRALITLFCLGLLLLEISSSMLFYQAGEISWALCSPYCNSALNFLVKSLTSFKFKEKVHILLFSI